jgi:hypothetical protein
MVSWRFVKAKRKRRQDAANGGWHTVAWRGNSFICCLTYATRTGCLRGAAPPHLATAHRCGITVPRGMKTRISAAAISRAGAAAAAASATWRLCRSRLRTAYAGMDAFAFYSRTALAICCTLPYVP